MIRRNHTPTAPADAPASDPAELGVDFGALGARLLRAARAAAAMHLAETAQARLRNSRRIVHGSESCATASRAPLRASS